MKFLIWANDLSFTHTYYWSSSSTQVGRKRVTKRHRREPLR